MYFLIIYFLTLIIYACFFLFGGVKWNQSEANYNHSIFTKNVLFCYSFPYLKIFTHCSEVHYVNWKLIFRLLHFLCPIDSREYIRLWTETLCYTSKLLSSKKKCVYRLSRWSLAWLSIKSKWMFPFIYQNLYSANQFYAFYANSCKFFHFNKTKMEWIHLTIVSDWHKSDLCLVRTISRFFFYSKFMMVFLYR